MSGTLLTMAYRETELGLIVRLHPDEAKTVILGAFVRAHGVAVDAAALLGISYRNLLRWSEKLNLFPAIDGIRESAHRKKSGPMRKIYPSQMPETPLPFRQAKK